MRSYFPARPVVSVNSSDSMSVSPSDPSLVVAAPLHVSMESTAHIICPVNGYPHPLIVWYKDGIPLETSTKVSFHKNTVEINRIEDEDAGIYRCVASNQFPIYVDGPEQEFEVKVDRQLRISG
ncbi:immunoglobulin domain protein [Dictyocaulus viviparus]|uniref:Immunoglobulin domain protein n=1 Tax=Dictyocaulus viviparus TaxID=29172 RepID=A0A0D8XQC6_DICVI|nr:immunoglobulin domain protein [Dictyocaulus viviparus]